MSLSRGRPRLELHIKPHTLRGVRTISIRRSILPCLMCPAALFCQKVIFLVGTAAAFSHDKKKTMSATRRGDSFHPQQWLPPAYVVVACDALDLLRAITKKSKRYQHKPTPSHPINICTKLSAATKIIIKNVDKDKYGINLGKCDTE